MYTFGRMENIKSLINEVGVLEGAIACELSAQDMVASRIPAEIQVDTEKELAHHHVAISSKHDEREKRVAAVREEGRERLEELRRKLVDAKHELAVIQSPILILPYEITAEIFNWHMLMGGNLKTMLLVCKRWTTVAYSSPRLWSRIAVTDRGPEGLRLRGALVCETVEYLRSALSRTQASPLQVQLSLSAIFVLKRGDYSLQSSSVRYGPRADANRHEAISLILNNDILSRCTYLALDYATSPLVVENMTVLPLLSSLYIGASFADSEIATIQSLVKLSPSLRHVRWPSAGSRLEGIDLRVWMERIESYGWLNLQASGHMFHQSSSLRELGIHDSPVVALTLPALQVLRWSLVNYSALHLITAPHLHTLILMHKRVSTGRLSAGSITLPNLRVAIHAEIRDIIAIHGFHTPALEHLSIQLAVQGPTALFELFDGSVHMPTPKSLHLEGIFTDAALIAVLGRLPWLEELQITGTIATDMFWEGLASSSKPTWRAWLPRPYPDERADRILTPNLKVLLVNYSDTFPRLMESRPRRPLAEIADDCSKGREWTVIHASAVAVAREQAGCPLETLACWSPERKVEVLIGSLDTLPQRPKWEWDW